MPLFVAVTAKIVHFTENVMKCLAGEKPILKFVGDKC
jgi:hypothetical protein